MSVSVVIGGQFGDEGKSKVTNLLLQNKAITTCVRFNGGANAGHTMVVDGTKYVVNAIPSSIVTAREREIMSVMGRGMVIHPSRLGEEMQRLNDQSVPTTPHNLIISGGIGLTLPYHTRLEAAREQKDPKGTTLRGISPTYASRYAYQGIRACYLADAKLEKARELIKNPLAEHNAILTGLYGMEPVGEDEVMSELEHARSALLPFIRDEIPYLHMERQYYVKAHNHFSLTPALGSTRTRPRGTPPRARFSMDVA